MQKLFRALFKTADTVDRTVMGITSEADRMVAPVRKSIFKRFPTLFMFLVTVGVTTTFLGIERIIEHFGIFEENPLLILLFGVSILCITGTLYKKLG